MVLMRDVYLQAMENSSEIQKDNLYEWLGKCVYITGCQRLRKKKAREATVLEFEQNEISSRKMNQLEAAIEIIHDCLTFDLVAPTGTKVIYSDVGYILLGLILEKIGGKSLDILAKEMVFEPLGMTNTSYQANMDTVCATEVNPFFLR